MSTYKIKHSYKQIYLAQTMMKLFVEKGWDTFESFLEIWKNNNISKLHSFGSFRQFIFGSCQTSISTFIGYCYPKKTIIEKKGGFFGIYLTYSTQFCQVPSPIQISTLEFGWIKEIAREFSDCNQIFSFLLRSEAFCFVPNQVAILTKFTDSQSPIMIDEFLPLSDAFKRLENLKEDKRDYEEDSNESIKDIKEDYNKLMDELRS